MIRNASFMINLDTRDLKVPGDLGVVLRMLFPVLGIFFEVFFLVLVAVPGQGGVAPGFSGDQTFAMI